MNLPPAGGSGPAGGSLVNHLIPEWARSSGIPTLSPDWTVNHSVPPEPPIMSHWPTPFVKDPLQDVLSSEQDTLLDPFHPDWKYMAPAADPLWPFPGQVTGGLAEDRSQFFQGGTGAGKGTSAEQLLMHYL